MTARAVGWFCTFPEVSQPKTEGLVAIMELFTHWNAIPLFCHVHWPVFFCLIYLKLCITYSICRENLLCGPIYFSTRREKRSKSIVQSLQVSTWQLTPWRVHHSKWTWALEELCSHMKPMLDFQCICLLIPHLRFETFHNHCEDALMSEQNRLTLEAKDLLIIRILKIAWCLFATWIPL